MGLVFKSAIEKAETIITKYENKRKELQERLIQLNDDSRYLQSQIEDDLQKAIMEDRKTNDKLKTDLNKVVEEREQVSKMLGNIDNLLNKALEDVREEVETDRKKVLSKGIQKQEAVVKKLKDAKLTYLKLLVEYNETAREVDQQLRPFRQIEYRLGIKEIPYYERRVFDVSVNRNYDKSFHPIITSAESREAFGGKLDYYATQYEKQK